METGILFAIIILILSVVIHEVAHGYAANSLGDPTARVAGRLTLNPLKHIDLMGSIIIPGLLVLSSSPILFGWAKPVPYNAYNLRKYAWAQKWGEALVAFAGPGVNILIALFFGVVVHIGSLFGFLTPAFIEISTLVVFINILLATINLIPIPPLDGSKVLAAFLPSSLAQAYDRLRVTLEYNVFLGFGLILLFIYLFSGVFIQFVYSLTQHIVGI
ncbi:MAG: site-2 protease family protein [Candidatus Pacebacteria bacterium]|nr:site-2 protease family protein [Candidatus Paceibacterota bacterium]